MSTQIPRDRPTLEIVADASPVLRRFSAASLPITPEMVEAGVLALQRTIGFQHEGDPDDAVVAVFEAMARSTGIVVAVALTIVPTES
jgi:hypothetical protein